MKRLSILLAILVLLAGCKAAPTQVAVSGGDAAGQIRAYTAASQRDVERAKSHVDPVGKELLFGVSTNLVEVAKQTSIFEKMFKSAVDFGAAAYNTYGNKIERNLRTILIIYSIIGAALLIIRYVAAFTALPIGAPMAMISSGFLNFMPPFSHLSSVADNIYFRKTSPTAPSTETVTTVAAVAQSTVPPGPTAVDPDAVIIAPGKKQK